MTEAYEAVIGLEVHVELKSDTKIFCGCKNIFHAPPNTCVCPVCMGLPGSMPVLNLHAVELAVRAGLATGCKIASFTRFDRKNYYYPDLPKAYQISQYEHPLCTDGEIDIGHKKIKITRIHMEEDAGKLVHHPDKGTLVDYNRCGIPLVEIVSEPDIRSAQEARDYLTELRTRLLYAGVSDCKMAEGSFRCDVNISVRKKGEQTMGVRAEIKNLNSFAFAAKAIEYEFLRQVELIESGGKVLPETRRFDEVSGRTFTMRVKETASDYRFFPEPDLQPFVIERDYVSRIQAEMPQMPNERRQRYISVQGLGEDEARIITSSPELADYYDSASALTKYPKICANILLTELLGAAQADAFECELRADRLAGIATLFGEERINSSTVKKLIKLCIQTGGLPEDITRENGLEQINDAELLKNVLSRVIEEQPKLLADYLGGKLAAQKAIIGRAMALTGGRANPRMLNELWEAFGGQ